MSTVIIDSPIKTFVIRKNIHDFYDYYVLILKHNATGKIFIYNLSNETTDLNYFKLTIDMTGNSYGEYTYYIAGNSPFWTINIDEDNIFNSCYYLGTTWLGAINDYVFIENNYDLAISGENDGECYPLHFLDSCILQYFSFDNKINISCNTYKQYECCK